MVLDLRGQWGNQWSCSSPSSGQPWLSSRCQATSSSTGSYGSKTTAYQDACSVKKLSTWGRGIMLWASVDCLPPGWWRQHISGLLPSFLREQEFMRDVVGCVKYYDYYIIPLIQIHTSPPIRRYIAAKWGRTDPNDLSFFLHIVTFTVFRPRVYIWVWR